MKRYIFLIACLLVVCSMFLVRLLVSASDIKSRQSAVVPVAKRVVVQAAGRGKPYINLEDGIELDAAYTGPAEQQSLLKQNAAEPRALASADFDEDGVPDLVCSYARPGGGIITLYRGNVDSVFPNSPEAQRRKADGTFTESAFLSPARVFDVPVAGDFVGAGDFDADGHWDVVVAACNGKELWLLPGDGKGNFLAPRKIELPGGVVSLITGEINRADGLTDIVVGVVAVDGPKVLVFEGPEGALKAQPEVFSLPAEPKALALGQLDADYPMDLAVGAGSELVIIHGRDRKLSLDESRQAEVLPARVERRTLGFEIRSIAVGAFTGGNKTSLSLLASDGTVYMTSTQENESRQKTTHNRKMGDVSVMGQWRGATQLICARVSTGPADDLIMLNKDGQQLQILKTGLSVDAGSSISAAVRLSTPVDLDSEPLAVLPMRLNADALSDLVILQAGHRAPGVVKTVAAMTFTVINTNDSGPGSLRQAILDANANPGSDLISFNIPGAGVHTISPAFSLPQITDPVSLDGTTQPGFAGTPIVELNGANVSSFGYGLDLSGGSSTVQGLTINRFLGSGIYLSINGNNRIEGNLLGTDVTGTVKLMNGGGGVLVQSTLNEIGGTTTAARNIVSGGVLIAGGGTTGNQVQGNLIGTDITGTASLGNLGDGVNIGFMLNNVVGGTVAGARNIISGNGGSGVRVNISSGNQIIANFIGTDVTGTTKLSNGLDGIGIFSPSNIIGGTSSGAGNVIAGNWMNGIEISDSGNINNQVQGNFIGTDKTGSAKLGNSRSGVSVSFAWNTIIGGAVPGARNVISGNGWTGIMIVGGSIATPATSVVQGNYIGTDVSGTGNLGNTLSGVVANGASIGGNSADTGNTIAFNGGNGVTVSFGPGNAIQRNSIFSNGRLGIDLGANLVDGIPRGDGVTNNDSCDTDTGPNNLQNFPALTSATSDAVSTSIQGTLNSTPDTIFTIEFFSNTACDPSGFGEGQTFLGSTMVVTDGNCNASFNVTRPSALNVGQFITATATDPTGNTSEFSNCVQVVRCITCPSDVNVAAPVSCPAQSGAIVNYRDPTVNCSSATAVCSPPSGSTFPVGSTTVTCTATDASGNTGQCTFTVSAFSFCLQDRTNPGNVVMVNAQTGDYFFCCGGVPIASGRGALNVRGCVGSIDQVKGDRRVRIQWDASANNNSGAGTATVRRGPAGTDCQITDKNMSNDTCRCSNQPL
jgi:hypothetical protein